MKKFGDKGLKVMEKIPIGLVSSWLWSGLGPANISSQIPLQSFHSQSNYVSCKIDEEL